MLLEIACFNLADALLAHKLGAGRIEFCADYNAGGLSPAHNDIKVLRSKVEIPIFVMIRPRTGDFFYTIEEFTSMKEQILFCKSQLCDGVVFGILGADHKIDKERCKELVELAAPMSCTFHRAFDETIDLERSLEELILCGFKRVLTSGGKGKAPDNAETLVSLVRKAGERILVMPGGGIRAENAREIIKMTSCQEIHSAAFDLKTDRLDPNELKALNRALAG